MPTATDIAFAVGVLALLGRSLPGSVRMFLLTLAVIDDVIAVLIIAVFYSGGLDWSGFLVVGLGVLMVLGMQSLGIGAAFAYVFPGAVVWLGFLMTGAHPTLAGVVLGLLTPVVPRVMREAPRETMARAAERLADGDVAPAHLPLRQWRMAERELLPPATRLIDALHPWVAFGIMPLFALANAGVSLQGTDLAEGGAHWVMVGVAVALAVRTWVDAEGLASDPSPWQLWAWTAVFVAMIPIAVLSWRRSRWWRRTVALLAVPPAWSTAVTGIVIIVAVTLAPGLVPLPEGAP